MAKSKAKKEEVEEVKEVKALKVEVVKEKKEPKEKAFGENAFMELSKKGKEVVSAMEVTGVGCVVKNGDSMCFVPGTKIHEDLGKANKKGVQQVEGRRVVPINFRAKK